MGFPRDYYRDEYGEPSLHSLHGSRPYVERDNLADMAHDQLPTLSTIGAGPQGAGVIPVPVVGEPGSYRFQLVSDETGEVLLTSDNLHPGEISVWSPAHEWVAGEAETVYIRVRKGDKVDEYPVEIPPGAVGSRWFVGPEAEYSSSNVYYFQVDDLQYDGPNSYRSKPVPRPNDLCAFMAGHDLVLGNVDACEAGTVVVVARTYIPVPVPEIGENGNWVVDGVDTGQPSKGDRGDDGLNAVVRIGNVEALPHGKASATMDVDADANVYTLNLGIPEGAPGKAIDIQGGIWTTDTLPDYDNTEVNTAFIVHDNDKQFDLYIRGRIPVTASDGGPWTVVEDWQGRPGTGTHMLRKPYVLGKSEGSIVRVPAAELSLAFAPYDYMSDGDVVIDTEMSVGILGSTEDDSGDYTVETMGTVTARWENVEGKPFDTVLDGDGLVVTEVSMDGEVLGKVLNIDPDSLSPKWDMVRDVPSSFPAKVDPDDKLLAIDGNGVLQSGNVTWSMVDGKPATYPHDKVSWDEIAGKPENFGIPVACTAVAEPSKKWLVQGDGDAWELGANVMLSTTEEKITDYLSVAQAAIDSTSAVSAGNIKSLLRNAGETSTDATDIVNGWIAAGLPEEISTKSINAPSKLPFKKECLIDGSSVNPKQAWGASWKDVLSGSGGTAFAIINNSTYGNTVFVFDSEKTRSLKESPSGRYVAIASSDSKAKYSPTTKWQNTIYWNCDIVTAEENEEPVSVPADALLTTDAISRSEPSDLAVYDEGGKLKVSEAAVAEMIPDVPAKEFVELQNYWFADDGLHLVLFSKMTADGLQVVLKQSGTDQYAQTVLEETELNGKNQVTSIVMDLSDQNGKSFDPSVASTVFVQGRSMVDGYLGNNTNTAASFVFPAKEAASGESSLSDVRAFLNWRISNNYVKVEGRIYGYDPLLFPNGIFYDAFGYTGEEALSYTKFSSSGYAYLQSDYDGNFSFEFDLASFQSISDGTAKEPDTIDISIYPSDNGAFDKKNTMYRGTIPIVRPITSEYIQSLFAS